jgi:NADPH-dependent glutamate synthase beta subunit-like oxidoreductase/ferredoxin
LCPANICNHGFFNSILAGEHKEALEIVRDKMLFAMMCGDICHRPCEFLYGPQGGATVPIKRVKQFVSGIEKNFSDFSNQTTRAARRAKNNKTVAVIGAGPAGLSAAYDLVRVGYDVTVYEKEKEAGGLLKFGIPRFRLGWEKCDTEITLIEKLGVKFKFNMCLGKDFHIQELEDECDAVVVAIGMGISSALDVIEENVPASQKYAAVPFLREYNENTLSLKPRATICVIGGGNSAVDAARASKRYDTQNDVIISCIEPRDEMPAFEEEIESALDEGIQIINGSDVDGCAADSGGKVRVKLRSLEETRETWDIACDYVITAVGQRGDKGVIGTAAVAMNEDDRILTDPASGCTKSKNVFAAGDICAGNHVSLIGAIASGKKAAVGVRKLLEEYNWPYEGQQALDVLNSSDELGRRPARATDARSDEGLILEEMLQFDIYQACAKCDHCIENFGCPALIKVGGRVTVDEYQCTRCGLCIDVCVNNAIRWADPIAIEH